MEVDRSNIDQPPYDTALHLLYRSCQSPMELYINTKALLDAGAAVNSLDRRGLSPLSLLILHCNRGLRHQALPMPEIQRLVDLNAPLRQIEDKCIEVDDKYQRVVLRSLVLLLSKGADTNFIAHRCLPVIPYNMNWNQNFDHKLIQTEQRWNLLGFGATMEVTTYNIFNPLSNCSVENVNTLTILHLAAWRGDYNALQLLLQHGADINTRTKDGRNALHFLYFYCNKPRELVEATSLLLDHGIDVNARDKDLRTPLFWLLRHIVMKRSHVKYLANSYSVDCHLCGGQEDNYHVEIKDCIDLLLRHGADINAVSQNGTTPLHLIYDMLEYSLQACDQNFQSRGHYMVPYDFSVKPLSVFSQFLIAKGAAINVPGRAPLHCLAQSLHNLSSDEALNSTDDIIRCFDCLLQAGADMNAQDHDQKTPIHVLIENVLSIPDTLPRYCRILSALQKYRPDFNKRNVRTGDTILHTVCNSGMRVKHLHRLLLLMLRCGADPSQANTEEKYPLHLLLKRHVYHHDPTRLGDVTINLSAYRDILALLCQTMTFQSVQRVFQIYKHEGFWGLVCENGCSVYQTLQESCQLRTLRHTCRFVIWKSMMTNFLSGYTGLPLPTELQRYVYDLVF